MQSILDLPKDINLPQAINLPKAINLPQEIISKILLYYWSYGTPSANIMRSENKCKGNSLWFTNVDYIYNHRIYLLQKSIGCSFDAICDLRLAIVDHNLLNGITNDILRSLQQNVINNIHSRTKSKLLQLLEEEEKNLIY